MGVLVPPLHKQSRLLTADKLSAVRGCSFCARAVRIPWPHEREPCVVGKWAAAGMVGRTGVDWWRESPGRVGWGLPFIAWS